MKGALFAIFLKKNEKNERLVLLFKTIFRH